MTEKNARPLDPVWKESLNLWAPVFRRAWSWLVFSTVLDVLSSILADTLRKISDVYTPLAIALTVTIQLLVSGFGIIIVNQLIDDVMEKRETHLMASLSKNMKYVFIESARALLKIILGFVLLIIPGIITSIHYYLVPYVAQFDPEYHTGKIDALEHSKALCKDHFWSFAWILILSSILSMVPGLWLGTIEVFRDPMIFCAAFFISMIMELYSDIVLFCAYKRLQRAYEEKKRGTSISLQGTSLP